jgi:hypothetical protein
MSGISNHSGYDAMPEIHKFRGSNEMSSTYNNGSSRETPLSRNDKHMTTHATIIDYVDTP